MNTWFALINTCLGLSSMQKQEALKQINATMILYKLLGLDKTAPEDIEELQEMRAFLILV